MEANRPSGRSGFGDGSSNNGTFHESLNLASLYKLPVVFVCENNLYGISLCQAKHMAITDVASPCHQL